MPKNRQPEPSKLLREEWRHHDAFAGDRFDHIALALFARQFEHNPIYRSFCESRGFSPSNISSWREIPALPTEAFKLASAPIRCHASDDTVRVFLTSGTTGETQGRHEFAETATYERSILEAWKQLELPAPPPNTLILTQAPGDSPNSSLVHMFETLRRHHQISEDAYLINSNGDFDTGRIRAIAETGQPLALLGTALAFLNLIESGEEPNPLPAGSWALETGGYKGSGRSLEKSELYSLFEKHLGLTPDQIINEYSMTELSSQCYTTGLGNPHRCPAWMRVRVISPETGLEVAPGETGLLIIHDLANLHSCTAIETRDLAVAIDDHSFLLLGRDPGALPRGCSRSADELLNS